MAIYITGLVAAAFSIVFLCEAVHRPKSLWAFSWAIRFKTAFFSNVLLAAACLIFFSCFTGNLGVSCIIVWAVYYTLGLVSSFKYAARNEPLYASDLLLAFKVMNVADKSNLVFKKSGILQVLLGVLLSGGLIFIKIPLWPFYSRIVLVFFSLVIFFIILEEYGKEPVQDFTYKKRGFILGFLINVYEALNGLEVIAFDENKVRQYVPPVPVHTAPSPPIIKPHIIMYLSESFFDIADPGLGLAFTADPLKNFRKIREESLHGRLLVTPFGGGTCNVEAEALLGVCVRHFNISNAFYTSYIRKKDVESLPRFLTGLGYEASAFHNFNKGFYDRGRAYERMGFGSFTGLEDLGNPIYSGRYPDDSNITPLIFSQLKDKIKPQFIMGVSMENHQPYVSGKFGDYRAMDLTTPLPDYLRHSARACARGLMDADEELLKIVEYVKNLEEPCVLLYFGDHLGALGPNLALYRRQGVVKSGGFLTPEEIIALYSPPFLVYSNYLDKKGDLGLTGANFLPKLLLDYIGFNNMKSDFYRLLDRVYEELHALSREDLIIDSQGRALLSVPKECKELEKVYKMYQYKNMGMGANFWDELFEKKL